jgi:hypothetical protein
VCVCIYIYIYAYMYVYIYMHVSPPHCLPLQRYTREEILIQIHSSCWGCQAKLAFTMSKIRQRMPKKIICSIMLEENPSLGENPRIIICEQTVRHRVSKKIISKMTRGLYKVLQNFLLQWLWHRLIFPNPTPPPPPKKEEFNFKHETRRATHRSRKRPPYLKNLQN